MFIAVIRDKRKEPVSQMVPDIKCNWVRKYHALLLINKRFFVGK